MNMGEAIRTSRPSIAPTSTVVAVEISIVAAAAAPASAHVAVIVVVIRIAPSGSWVHGLYGDLGSGLSCGIEGLSPRVVLGP